MLPVKGASPNRQNELGAETPFLERARRV